MKGDTYPEKTRTGNHMWLTQSNAEQWRADGLGIDDIAAKTSRRRDYVKAKLIEWGLWV